MFIVYQLTFENRKKKNIKPFLYIGSKSKCEIKDGKILDSRKKEYWSSSKSKEFNKALKEEFPTVKILFEGKDSKEINIKEYEISRELNVHTSIDFFNMFIPPVNNFIWNDYGTYKHNLIETKVVRLHKNDPLVLNGTFVGVTKGIKYSVERKQKISKQMTGEKNHFYGKKHTEKTKNHLSETKKGKNEHWLKRSPESKQKYMDSVSKPKTEEHKRKIGRKGFITLKSLKTGKCCRIKKEIYEKEYDKFEWVHPGRWKKIKGCNNEN